MKKKEKAWYLRPNYMKGWATLFLLVTGSFVAFCMWVAMMASLPARVEAGEIRLDRVEDILERMIIVEELSQKQYKEQKDFYQNNGFVPSNLHKQAQTYWCEKDQDWFPESHFKEGG